MRGLAYRIVHAKMFEYVLIVLIISSAVLQGFFTSYPTESEEVDPLFYTLVLTLLFFWNLTWLALVFEMLLKMFVLSPRVDRYFRDGWNVFDFLAISFWIISAVFFGSVHLYGIFFLTIRLLRLLQGLSVVQGLHFVLSTMFRSIPSITHIAFLLGLVLYVYALVGYGSFAEHDEARWGSLGSALLTLFEIATLEGWPAIMHPIIEVAPLAVVYFISFIIITVYIVTNVFVAVIISSMDDVLEGVKQDRRRQPLAPASKEEILQDLRSTQQALRRLEERVQQLPD